MDPEYLSILMCPKTRGTLRLATQTEIDAANARIRAGAAPETEVLSAGLVCEDGSLIYPVRDGIPVLLAAEAISIDSVAGEPSATE